MLNLKRRGADNLVGALRSADVKTIFSLSGNQIMPVYDAVFDQNIRIVHTRHEGAAVYMAEAAAQLTGRIGVALLTAGPGFANGLSAMYSALESETPLLVLSGDAPLARDGRGAFQELDQCAAAGPMTKGSFRVRDAGQLGEDVRRAIALATSGRPGPVHLALPDDVLRAEAFEESTRSVIPQPDTLGDTGDAAISLIQDVLTTASRPIVALGPAFARPAWKPKLGALAERLNVPVVAFESPRGLRAPRLGAFAEVLNGADALIALGKPLDFMVGFADPANVAENCRILQVDCDQTVLKRDRGGLTDRALEQAHVDPARVIDDIIASNTLPPNSNTSWRQTVDDAIRYRPADWSDAAADHASIKSLHLAQAIKAFLVNDPTTNLIIDGGEIGQWCQAVLDADNAMINGPSGAIGGALPYAIGAKASSPDRPVITIMGDGTAGFYLAEFETAVREDLPFVVVIGNDARWNAEHQIQVRDYGDERAFGCALTPARYDRVAADLGGYGEQVTELSQIGPAITRAFASGKPACVNVMIDGQAAPVIKRQAD